MIKALPLDAVVLIGGCDKTIPAELMGAISADMPAIVVNVGSMLAGKHEGTRLGACTDCRGCGRQYRAGSLDGPRPRPRARPAHADLRHLHGDGHRLDHGLHGRDAGLHAAGLGDRARGVVRPLALCRSDRQARRRDGQDRRAAAERASHQGRAAQRLGGAAGDLGLDQRPRASRRHRRTRRHHLRFAGARSRRPRGAGAARSQARRQEFHGRLPLRRQPAGAVAAAEGPPRSQSPRRSTARPSAR